MALTTFSFMAKQTEGLAGPELSTLNDCGEAGCGFTKFYQFKGVVGVYAGFWAYTVILIAMYVIRKAPPPTRFFQIRQCVSGAKDGTFHLQIKIFINLFVS